MAKQCGRWASIFPPGQRRSARAECFNLTRLETMPTSREIITEVSGMSPNICQYCIKAVGEMPGMVEGYPTPQRLRGTWTIDPLADLS
ncbi:hypothetical protein E0H47_14450 [Rhizobium leguminosarum bv. viciae]|nr:hypothetical protein E0H47_14450 [Rhizobium leguminosarum bv. viciae]